MSYISESETSCQSYTTQTRN